MPNPDDKASEQDLARLQDVIVAFQKTLASVAQTTAQAMRDTPAARLGLRSVYGVRQLQVELRAGFSVGRGSDGVLDQVLVDFKAPPETAGTISFEVAGERIPEPVSTDLLLLTRPAITREDGTLHWIREVRPSQKFEVQAALYLASGEPLRGAPVDFTVRQGKDPEWLPLTSRVSHGKPQQETTNADGVATLRVSLPKGLQGPLLRITAVAPEAPGRKAIVAEPLFFTVTGQGE